MMYHRGLSNVSRRPRAAIFARGWRLTLAAIGLAAAAVPITQGPLAADAKAQFKLPEINLPKPKLPTIVPKPEKVSGCGARGENPCKAWQAFPSCEPTLAEDILKGYCRTENGTLIKKAQNAFRELGPLIKTIGGSALRCGVDTVMSGASKRSHRQTAELLLGLPCFNGMLAEARTNGYRTLAIGGSGGASIGIGAEGENGFAFDTSGNGRVATYHTLSLKFMSIGASTSVNISLYKNAYNRIGGDAHGVSMGVAAVGGGGAAVWYSYGSDRVEGLTAVLTAGGKGELAYVRNTTRVVDAFAAQPRRVVRPSPPPPPPARPRAPDSGNETVEIDLADLLPEIAPPPSRPKPEFGWSGYPLDGNYRASKDAASLTRYFLTDGRQNQKLFYRYRNGNGAWSKWRGFNLKESGLNYHHYVENNGSGQSFTIWNDGDRIDWKSSQKRGASGFSMAFERYLGRYCDGRICSRSEWGPGAARR